MGVEYGPAGLEIPSGVTAHSLMFSATRRGKTQNKNGVILGSQTPSPHHPLIFLFFYSFIQSYIGKANLA